MRVVPFEAYRHSSLLVLGPFKVVIPFPHGVLIGMLPSLPQQGLWCPLVVGYEIGLTLDAYHNWRRKGFAELKNECCCCKQTLPMVNGLSNHLDDS